MPVFLRALKQNYQVLVKSYKTLFYTTFFIVGLNSAFIISRTLNRVLKKITLKLISIELLNSEYEDGTEKHRYLRIKILHQ